MKLLRDFTPGQYHPGSSPVHRIDPRAKLLACLMAMVATFAPGRPWGMVCGWPLLALGVAASRLPAARFLRGLRPVGWLFAFLVVFHGLTAPAAGPEAGWIAWLGLSAEGLARGAWVACQMATAIAFSSLLTLTTSPADLVSALERLAAPLVRLRLPVQGFCCTLLVALRLIPALFDDIKRDRAVPQSAPTGWLRTLSSQSADLFHRLLARAEAEIETVLAEARGPDGLGARGKRGRLGLRDGLVLGAALLTAVVSAAWSG